MPLDHSCIFLKSFIRWQPPPAIFYKSLLSYMVGGELLSLIEKVFYLPSLMLLLVTSELFDNLGVSRYNSIYYSWMQVARKKWLVGVQFFLIFKSKQSISTIKNGDTVLTQKFTKNIGNLYLYNYYKNVLFSKCDFLILSLLLNLKIVIDILHYLIF